MSEELPLLLEALREAGHFEDAAEALLRVLLRVAQQALEDSPHSGGQLLRGVVHLRPGEVYRGLVVVEPEGSAREEEASVHTSSTAWRAVVEHRCVLTLDVARGVLELHPPRGEPVRREADLLEGGLFASDESQQRFLGRMATHVCVLPLLHPGGGLDGMVSLEAHCLTAMGQGFIWPRLSRELQLLVDVAAPYLCGLPQRPTRTEVADEYLPVVGRGMARLLPMLRVFAQGEETLLISGPTGSGKSRLARWCHAHSSRREGPFEVLDLLAVPEELQMAELFGWKRGAFTGAERDNPGSLGRARGGTLFIDEIDKLSLKAQAGLLRVLEERTFRPLGEQSGERRADVRFIVGTNARLLEEVKKGRFREDLYYRIHVLPVCLPPLGERLDEVGGWARYMLEQRHRADGAQGQARLSAGAERLLATYRWPGNLRQLDNIVRRAYMLAQVEHGGGRDMELSEEHVRQALGYEHTPGQEHAPGSAPLLETMHAAARSFVEEARQRQETPMELSLAESFTGMVLGVAVGQLGRDEAFRLFGLEHLVKARNHSRTLKRELEKVEALCQALGGVRSPLEGLD